jgi:transposase-like protein
MTKTRSSFRPNIKPATAQQLAEKQLSVMAACEEMGVSSSSMKNWIRQAHREIRKGACKTTPITRHFHLFQALEKQLQALETEKDNLLRDVADILKPDSPDQLNNPE